MTIVAIATAKDTLQEMPRGLGKAFEKNAIFFEMYTSLIVSQVIKRLLLPYKIVFSEEILTTIIN